MSAAITEFVNVNVNVAGASPERFEFRLLRRSA